MIFCFHQTVTISVLHLSEAKCTLSDAALVYLYLFESFDGGGGWGGGERGRAEYYISRTVTSYSQIIGRNSLRILSKI